jgi:D-amino-acid dehydrogenase
MSTSDPTSVVVIGGGAVGLITAYHLAREGVDVTVLDARRTGRGAAEVNAGWICPAESAPVPGPGMIAQSLKWMLRRDSPLYIRPSLDPTFVKFMLAMWVTGPSQWVLDDTDPFPAGYTVGDIWAPQPR